MIHYVCNKVEILDLLMTQYPRVLEEKGYFCMGPQSVSWNEGNLIFVPDHALDKETRDNVGYLAM
jgi:hypothetical protein